MMQRHPLLRIMSLVASLLAAMLLVGTASAQSPITIQLAQQNDSGITGTATLEPMGSQTKVTLVLQNAPAGGVLPTHIHAGTCDNLNPAPAAPLTSVQNGRSETVVNMSIDQIRAAPHAINVHKSAQEVSVYVACGNLPTGTAAGVAGLPRTGAGGTQSPTDGIGGLAAVAALLVAGGLVITIRRRIA